MKTKLFTLVLSLLFVAGLNAQVKLLENFNYTAGDTLGAHGWTSFSGGPVNPVTITAPGLTFTNYINSGIGNAGRMRNSGQDYYKQFTGDSVFAGSLYVSFMLKVDSAKTGDYFIGLLPPTSTTLYTSRFYVKDSSGLGFLLGISKGAASGGPIVYGTTIYSLNTTYMVVYKYKFNTGTTTDDEMSFYVFNTSVPATEPGTPTVGPVVGTVTDATSFGRIGLRQGSSASSPTLTIDGLQVATAWTSITNVTPISTVATDFSLSQNYPNPFNPSTTIKFALPKSGNVTLKIYNSIGKEVETLVNENMGAGSYEVSYDASQLNSGMYFYRISANGFTDTKKMMLVK